VDPDSAQEDALYVGKLDRVAAPFSPTMGRLIGAPSICPTDHHCRASPISSADLSCQISLF
jgi:hypothetical protein